MDKPTLEPYDHNPLVAPTIPIPQTIVSAPEDPPANKPHRPPMLRRVSRSETHLDLPHHWNMPEQDNGWQRTLSGLFEVGSSFNLTKLMGSQTNVAIPEHHKLDLQVEPSLERKSSALELATSEAKDSISPLRKTSSVATFGPPAHLAPPTHNTSLSHTNLSSDTDHGIMMRAPAAAATLTGAATIASGLGNHGAETGTNLQQSSSASNKGWGSFFNSGFLSKPAYKSEEENRRYIMAFDRY